MKKSSAVFIMSVVMLSVPHFLSSADAISITTGSKVGTYYQIGLDIAKVAKAEGVDVTVKTSAGSIDNIKMMERGLAELGIVQSDALAILYKMNPKIAEHLRYIFPLYHEEIHILAKKEINSIEDLRGKKIATGHKNSGSWVTITNLLYWTIVPNVKKMTELNPLEALNALLAGEIDAMVYVAGKPVALFKRLESLVQTPRYKKMLDEIHFVPLSKTGKLKEICSYYTPSEIGPSDYTWVDQVTPTLSVKSLLVNLTTRHDRYEKDLVRLAEIMRKHIAGLKRNGHDKWKQVDLKAPIGEPWKQESCVIHQVSSEEMKQDLNNLFK